MDEVLKKKPQKDIKKLEEELREQYKSYGEKANKGLADIWNEIMWSEKISPTERKLSDEKLKKIRNLFIKALEERKKEEEKIKKTASRRVIQK
jgi:hypothetical protein